MHHTTGLSRAEIENLAAGVATTFPHLARSAGRAHALGLFTRVRLTLMALRMNLTQAQLGELFEVSQAHRLPHRLRPEPGDQSAAG